MTDSDWSSPLSQALLYSLPGQPFKQIALDLDAYTGCESSAGLDLYGLEDLRCIETIGELSNIKDRALDGSKATEGEIEHGLGFAHAALAVRRAYSVHEFPIRRVYKTRGAHYETCSQRWWV